MNSETKLVFELWDYIRDVIPAGKRSDAVLFMLRLFDESGLDFDRHDLEGECEYLDEALQAMSEEIEEFDDYDDDRD